MPTGRLENTQPNQPPSTGAPATVLPPPGKTTTPSSTAAQPAAQPPPINAALPANNYQRICRTIVDDKSRTYASFQRAELQARFLAAHNQDRNRFGLSSLTWNDELAVYAQRRADYLRDNYGCEMRHRSHLNMREGKMYGENLAFFWTSRALDNSEFTLQPEQVVATWDSECADYSLASNDSIPGKQCGHFTQVVWQHTKQMGCGVAMCNAGNANFSRGGRAEIWVCNYDPPGNFIDNATGKVGRPFTTIATETTQINPIPRSSPPASSTPTPAAPGNDRTSSTTLAKLVLYGTEQCGLCKAAKKLLDENNIDYVFNDLQKDQSHFSKLPPEVYANKFPYVFLDGKYQGGLDNLRELLNAGTLPKR